MIKLQLGNIFLDTYAKEQIELSWEGFRFQKNLRAGFTNDLTIPKTANNLSALKAVGLLDSTAQMFGSKTVKGILQVELRLLQVYVQVCSVSKNEIGICVYEDIFPEYMKEKTLRDFFKDTVSTIIPWNAYSVTGNYSSYFKEYSYGMTYNTYYAQYHPVRTVNSLISALNFATGYNMPTVDSEWYYMSTRKKVCPENKTQMIEGICDLSTGVMALSGGNHITNDLSIQYGDGQNVIVFNRACRVTLNMYLTWEAKLNSYQTNFIINNNLNGTNDTRSIQVRGDTFRNGLELNSFVFNMQEGSRLSFALVNSEYYKNCNFLIDAVIDNYTITEDDYDEDLDYIWRAPQLKYYTWLNGEVVERTANWNGGLFTAYLKERNSGTTTVNISTPIKSLSYFGMWVNTPNVKLCDFWFSLQWLVGKKLSFDHNKTVTWSDSDQKASINGYITQIRPKSDKLGQNNYIAFKDDETPMLVSQIDNEWLTYKNNFHESKFGKVENLTEFYGKINQYSNPSKEEDSNEYKCDFNEIDDLTIWWHNIQTGVGSTQHNYIRGIPIPTMDLDKLTQSYEVDITTFTPQLRDKDIIYLDGRKYFIVSCKTNIDTQRSELTCILIPNQNNIQ